MPRPPIKDEFTKLPVSRQRKYQLRKQKSSRCIICGIPVTEGTRCLMHLKANRERAREANGCQTRRPSSLSYRLEEALKNTPPPKEKPRPRPQRIPR